MRCSFRFGKDGKDDSPDRTKGGLIGHVEGGTDCKLLIYLELENYIESHQPSGLRWFSVVYLVSAHFPLPLFPRGSEDGSKFSKILPKIDPKMHRFFDRFGYRFFSLCLLGYWGQLGAHVGQLFAQNTGTLIEPWVVFAFAGSMLFFDILIFWSPWPHPSPVLARFWRVGGSILEVCGVHFFILIIILSL